MNFTFQRNPERLLDLCGLSPIRDRRQEKLSWKSGGLEAQDLRLWFWSSAASSIRSSGTVMPSAPAIPPICEPDTTSVPRALRKPQNA